MMLAPNWTRWPTDRCPGMQGQLSKVQFGCRGIICKLLVLNSLLGIKRHRPHPIASFCSVFPCYAQFLMRLVAKARLGQTLGWLNGTAGAIHDKGARSSTVS